MVHLSINKRNHSQQNMWTAQCVLHFFTLITPTCFSLSVVVCTSASITHNCALKPGTPLQTAEMDAYTVESMKLKGSV